MQNLHLKKTILLSLFFITLFSCKKEKQLIEVDLPDPDYVEEVIYSNPAEVKTSQGHFKMPGLKYQYNDLEPYIDAKTMELHYSRHHLGFANKLNLAVKDTDLKIKKIVELLEILDINNVFLRNNAGGFYNHNLYFEILSAKKDTKPSSVFGEAIIKDFGSFNEMKKQLIDKANNFYGSGWIWIIVDKKGSLKIVQTNNEENPLMKNAIEKGTPIFALDVWEHAYYIKNNNAKGTYLENIFNIINWEIVSKKYDEAITIK